METGGGGEGDDGGLRQLVERGDVRDVHGLERHGDPMGLGGIQN